MTSVSTGVPERERETNFSELIEHFRPYFFLITKLNSAFSLINKM